jgi:hypothetical protein
MVYPVVNPKLLPCYLAFGAMTVTATVITDVLAMTIVAPVFMSAQS